MMRSGRLLAENSPQNLLNNYRLSSLEDVFLKLCMRDDGIQKGKEALTNDTNSKGSLVRQQLRVDELNFNKHGASQSEIPSIEFECQQTNNNDQNDLSMSLALYPLSIHSTVSHL